MRHLSNKVRENTSTDKNSHIYKHFLSSPNCKSHYTDSCFTSLDTANVSSTLEIKEALHINKLKPELNKQVLVIEIYLGPRTFTRTLNVFDALSINSQW